MSWRRGARTSPARTSPTGASSLSPGLPNRATSAVTKSSITSTKPTVPDGHCAGSMSRSPRPREPWPGRCRSSATGSFSCPAAPEGQPGPGGQSPGPGAGLKGYVTNLEGDAETIIGTYHRLSRIEKSFRMSVSDLRACPIYHHKHDSIEAHLSIVFAILAASRWFEERTGWSIKRFIKTARHYCIVQIGAGALGGRPHGKGPTSVGTSSCGRPYIPRFHPLMPISIPPSIRDVATTARTHR